jgi:hypothetical protein
VLRILRPVLVPLRGRPSALRAFTSKPPTQPAPATPEHPQLSELLSFPPRLPASLHPDSPHKTGLLPAPDPPATPLEVLLAYTKVRFQDPSVHRFPPGRLRELHLEGLDDAGRERAVHPVKRWLFTRDPLMVSFIK